MDHSIENKIIAYLKKYQPRRIAIFGSFARGENHEHSDLDLLVDFKKAFGLLELVKIEQDLSKIVGRKVDLVTERALNNEKLRKYIEKDLKVIFK